MSTKGPTSSAQGVAGVTRAAALESTMSTPPWRTAITSANVPTGGAVAHVENLTADLRPRCGDPGGGDSDAISAATRKVDDILGGELLRQTLSQRRIPDPG